MTKNPPTGERIAYAKRALKAAEFVDEAAAWTHRLILDNAKRPASISPHRQRIAENAKNSQQRPGVTLG